MKNIATNAYNQAIKSIEAWEKKSFFNREKYQPEPYRLFNEVYRLQNHVIAIGEAETARCCAILNLCSLIIDMTT